MLLKKLKASDKNDLSAVFAVRRLNQGWSCGMGQKVQQHVELWSTCTHCASAGLLWLSATAKTFLLLKPKTQKILLSL